MNEAREPRKKGEEKPAHIQTPTNAMPALSNAHMAQERPDDDGGEWHDPGQSRARAGIRASKWWRNRGDRSRPRATRRCHDTWMTISMWSDRGRFTLARRAPVAKPSVGRTGKRGTSAFATPAASSSTRA